MTHIVYIALGSNLGDRQANLRAALEALAPEVVLLASSPVYLTPPWGYADQPAFLNQVTAARTALLPRPLLDYLKDIEKRVGREPTFHFGPRKIDLDILFYDDLVLETKELTIPHPLLHKRAFVLVPLADLAPELRHPVLGCTVAELLADVDPDGITPWPDSGSLPEGAESRHD